MRLNIFCWLMSLAMAFFAGLAWADGSVPKPVIAIENPGECVAPLDVIRRSHMDLLKHQRDRTVRLGERGANVGKSVTLNGCIDCHASKKTGSVLGNPENFCQGCHAYVAVKLDCFECHQPKSGMVVLAGPKP